MKFSELDRRMRVYETAHDHCVLPGIFMVARIDGRNFTRLTKELLDLEAPFDVRFRDAMLETAAHLMGCGFRVSYGFVQSDEISLLFHRNEGTFGRKERKFTSILAGEASAKFALTLGALAAFDCRIAQLPNAQLVVDYFRWRSEDAHRNALNAHCYWMQRRAGLAASAATQAIERLSTAQKNELLFQGGVNFNDLPSWQKRGVGLWWETAPHIGTNPLTGEQSQSERTRLHIELELPLKEAYDELVRRFVDYEQD